MSVETNIAIQHEDFDVGIEVDALSGTGVAGAVATFVGFVRGGADDVLAMTLEHYPGMTERTLRDIVGLAQARWFLLGVRVIHRVGRLLPGERIVFVGVAGRHRGEAFAACQFIMDYLKTQAPFWKKEETANGARWVDARDSDEAALKQWQT
ncbi:MAG: moaE [Rhodocyclales bacterium]|nr:moaE [Rhodocyclales bacterium]